MMTHKFSIVFFLSLLFFVFQSCGPADTDTEHLMHDFSIQTSPIEITWELNSNFEEDNQFSATLTLHNTSDEAFPAEGWALYLNSIRPLVAESFLPELTATLINGDFFKLEPTDEFQPIEPGGERVIDYKARFFSIKKTDAPQGFYFVFDDGTTIKNVDKVEILPFTREEQVNRSPGDLIEVPTSESIFQANTALSLLNLGQISKITPTPRSVQPGDETFTLTDGIEIHYHEYFSNEANYLADMLSAGYNIQARTHLLMQEREESGILLNLDVDTLESDESYILDVSPGLIEIKANDSRGIFYGVQSLRALIDNRTADNPVIETVRIEDEPAFPYRGMHLDVSRNFQSVDDVKRLLDVMAMYKLNRFHFHLTDDEGWRLAIDPLPELVEVGGRRGHTEDESEYLIPSYGSGPDPTPGRSFGSGWYTRAQYIDILQFAAERHIEVIPEIDVPGHARAAIIAMKVRAERLHEAGDPEAAEFYRLDEEADQSEYRSIQNFDDNVINVCQESTYRFMEVVIDEIVDMHRAAGAPLSTIHVGGDEVPHGVWEESPACRQLMDEEGIENVRDLQIYFFDRLQTKLENRNLLMAGWEEVAFRELEDGTKTPHPEFVGSTIPHVWSNIWGADTEDYAYKLANMGYKVVMSHASNFYFDMAYNKHWEEPGFYWASMFNTKEPYSFIPFNLYRNAVQDNYGNPIPENQFDDAVQLRADARENILGLQGQLWTETVNREGRMDYMIYPRLLALAERAWVGDSEWSEIAGRDAMFNARDEAWNEFANRLGRFELKRLDTYYPDMQYRIPPPGAVVENGRLIANTDFPGLEIRYELGGSSPSEGSPVYEGPVDLNGTETVKLATFNSVGRSSRVIAIEVLH